MLLWPTSLHAKEDPTKILCTSWCQSAVDSEAKFHWFCRAWRRQAYSDDFFREGKVQRQRREGKTTHLAEVEQSYAHISVCDSMTVPVGSVHALSSGLKGGRGVWALHTLTDGSWARGRQFFIYLCLLEGLALLAPLGCVRAEEADVLIGISDLNLQKEIKKRVCNWNAIWWYGDRKYHSLKKGESSFQAS